MKIFKKILVSLSTAFLLGSAVASNIETVQVEASGLTKQDAIAEALVEAVRQINGVSIASETRSAFKQSSSYAETSDDSVSGEYGESCLKKDIQTATKGQVSSYKLLDAIQQNGTWTVTVDVCVPVYKTPGNSPHNRRKLAVLPFRSSGGQTTMAAKRIAQLLTDNLTQTRRFSVLDREYTAEFLREKSLVVSGEMPIEEMSKVGQVLGVDYLIVGSVDRADLSTTKRHIEITGRTAEVTEGVFSVQYRVIVMATRQVKWTDTMVLNVSDVQFGPSDQTRAAKIEKVYNKLANQISAQMMENIYPVRIVGSLADGTLILNQGGRTLAVGQRMDLFALGDQLTDQYSGESLGREEQKIGEIEIIRVTAKTAYAKIISGIADENTEKMICRRVTKQLEQSNSGRKSSIKIDNNGGVKLPFD